MNERIKNRLNYLQSREYRLLRSDKKSETPEREKGESAMIYSARVFACAVENEEAVFYGEDDSIGFHLHQIHPPTDGNGFGNVVVDYKRVLKIGLDGYFAEIGKRVQDADSKKNEFYSAARICLFALKSLVKKWRDKAKEEGRNRLHDALLLVPEGGASDFYQATITCKFMQYALRLGGCTHITLGRFDRYCLPYYLASKENGKTKEELLEETENFFLSLNFDSDLYSVVQTGDNGQSLVLGPELNELSEICLSASEELRLIDPKINVRVNKDTSLTLYERCTKLTKQGLGFPQYSNDDIVVPGLIALGYEKEDAENYAVAACWEFITSGVGADIPNIATMNYPKVVETAVKKHLWFAGSFGGFMKKVEKELKKYAAAKMKAKKKYHPAPKPLLSVFITPCIERGKDLSCGGAKYNNFGMHGAGLSTAADALAAIEKVVFEEKTVSKKELLSALKKNFVGYEGLRKTLLACPKMGNNDDYVDEIAGRLTSVFSAYVNGSPNGRDGVWRAGTGSAQEYVFSGRKVGATADGRKAGEPFGCSYSPSLQAVINGPLSVIQSFTKIDLKTLPNGGPFTIEIHDNVFRNEEGEKKVAALIRSYFLLGGHQMQINAINRDRLLEAQKNPEKHPNLIVRVWGWSGYFNELDPEFQDHIIKRCEYGE
ncbi:MAG: pyruvate formate-lyase [Clostridia bacterium]|nr:pyruvate formate-lyase [Clostridia bacterium]